MTQQQMNGLLDQIAQHSRELYEMIELFKSFENNSSSDAWLTVFDEITQAWFNNDCARLDEVSKFVQFGTLPKSIQVLDLSKIIFDPTLLTKDKNLVH